MSLAVLQRFFSPCVLIVWLAACGTSAGASGPTDDAGNIAHDAGDDAGPTLSDYAQVELIVRRSCMFESCHSQGAGKARLNFNQALAQGHAITELLNDVPACEYSALPRIRPGKPDESWLYIKLSSTHDAAGRFAFTPDAKWSAMIDPNNPALCPITDQGKPDFGQVMPLSGTVSAPLASAELALFKRWITAGAPDH
jgi:hypothetical protein